MLFTAREQRHTAVACIAHQFILQYLNLQTPLPGLPFQVDLAMVWGTTRGIEDLVARLKEDDPTLSSLCLMRQRRLGVEDATDLCQALARNTKVHDLDISSHNITPDMAESFAAMLQLNKTLRSISLGNRSFGDRGLIAMCSGIAANQSLVKLNVESRGITELGCQELARALTANQTIEELLISDNNIGDLGLSYLIPACSRLRVLAAAACGLSDSQIFGDALGHLFSMTPPVLEALDLSRNKIGPQYLDQYAKHLQKVQSLRAINISGCSLGHMAMPVFCSSLPPSLTHLDLSHTGAGTEGISALSREIAKGSLPLLKRLVLCSCDADDTALSTLLASLGTSPCQPGSVELDLGGNSAGKHTIESIAHCPPLQNLSLHNCGLGSDEIYTLVRLLGGVQYLQELDLSANRLQCRDIVHLLDALRDEKAANKLELLVIAANPGSKEDAVARALTSLQEVRQLLNVVRGNIDGRE